MSIDRIKNGILFLLFLLCGFLAGCGTQESESEYYYYHLDADGTALVKDNCDLTDGIDETQTSDASVQQEQALTGSTFESESADASGDAQNTDTQQTDLLIEALIMVINNADPETLLPEEVMITGYSRSGIILVLDFNAAYLQMDATRELLCRAAVAESMLQFDQITGVSFTVEGEALTDADGSLVGLMTENTFITNPASQINAAQEVTVALYFTDSDGKELYQEQRTLYYFTSVSVEWMIVQKLIDGPSSDAAELCATLPAETSVINVTTADGICYVNLDQTFLSTTFTVIPEVAIYSIVNSLCELDGIDSVQILIDGESEILYQESIWLNQNFTMNEDLIADDAAPIETEVPAEDE